jgi:hypothetical protein
MSCAFWRRTIPGLFLLGLAFHVRAMPPAEELLPESTMVMLTAPDFSRARVLWDRTEPGRLWQDPSMEPVATHVWLRLKTEMIVPLEQSLGFSWNAITNLPDGQWTFAIARMSHPSNTTAMILMMETSKERQAAQLIDGISRHWARSGRGSRILPIRGRNFAVLEVGRRLVPDRVWDALSGHASIIGTNSDAGDLPACTVFVGLAGKTVIVSDSEELVAGVLTRADGETLPSLAKTGAFATAHLVHRKAALQGWLNLEAFLDNIRPAGEPSALSTTNEVQDPALFARGWMGRMARAAGLDGVRGVALGVREQDDGLLTQLLLVAPETHRTGLLKALNNTTTGTLPPSFVPDDVVSYQRWRVNAGQVWDLLPAALGQLSPHMSNTFCFLLDSADSAAKLKDPPLDLRGALRDFPGNDVILFSRRASGGTNGTPPATLCLIGTSRPVPLLEAIQSLFVLLPQNAVGEREFQGRKIFSIGVPPMPFVEHPVASGRILYYAAGTNHVAFSTDARLVEAFLCETNSTGAGLAECSAFRKAVNPVGEPEACVLCYASGTTASTTADMGTTNGVDAGVRPDRLWPLPLGLGMGNELQGLARWIRDAPPPRIPIVAGSGSTALAICVTTNGIFTKVFSAGPRPESK